MKLKVIETEYKGIKFRSKLEAQWAVLFDELNIKWEYEPEGYDLGNGLWYLPDFLIDFNDGWAPMYVEVKGCMTDTDAEKIKRLEGLLWDEKRNVYSHRRVSCYVLVLGSLPYGNTLQDMLEDLQEKYCKYSSNIPYKEMYYRYEGLTHERVIPACFPSGEATWITWNYNAGYGSSDELSEFTAKAYYNARNYRFDHKNKDEW